MPVLISANRQRSVRHGRRPCAGRPILLSSGAGQKRATSAPVTGIRKKRTVVVADGNHISRESVTKLLARQGYRVVQASDGVEALAVIRGGGVDLLVTAVVMKGMDGLELLRVLRALAIELPVIAVSDRNAAIDKVYLRAASLLGASRTYTQPQHAPAFLMELSTLLRSPAE